MSEKRQALLFLAGGLLRLAPGLAVLVGRLLSGGVLLLGLLPLLQVSVHLSHRRQGAGLVGRSAEALDVDCVDLRLRDGGAVGSLHRGRDVGVHLFGHLLDRRDLELDEGLGGEVVLDAVVAELSAPLAVDVDDLQDDGFRVVARRGRRERELLGESIVELASDDSVSHAAVDEVCGIHLTALDDLDDLDRIQIEEFVESQRKSSSVAATPKNFWI